jgi:hypothetical protein
MGITPHSSVEAFFREVLLESMGRQGVSTTEGAEYYIVGLLGNFTKARITDEPLSMKLVGSQDDPAKRVQALKEVGDTSLYVTGFFSDSLQRRLVRADYYKTIGAAAYRELAHRLAGSSVTEVYEELAEKFPDFVDVLSEVRQQINFAGTDVVQLYEQWLSSRSEWVEGRLRKLGVLVGGSDDDTYH